MDGSPRSSKPSPRKHLDGSPQFDAMSVAELKSFITDAGLDFDDCVEKSELIARAKQGYGPQSGSQHGSHRRHHNHHSEHRHHRHSVGETSVDLEADSVVQGLSKAALTGARRSTTASPARWLSAAVALMSPPRPSLTSPPVRAAAESTTPLFNNLAKTRTSSGGWSDVEARRAWKSGRARRTSTGSFKENQDVSKHLGKATLWVGGIPDNHAKGSESMTRWVVMALFLPRALHAFSASKLKSAPTHRLRSLLPQDLPGVWHSFDLDITPQAL